MEGKDIEYKKFAPGSEYIVCVCQGDMLRLYCKNSFNLIVELLICVECGEVCVIAKKAEC